MMNFSDETVEKCASKIWDCVPSMCDETWKEAKAATDFEHKECVATYYRFARAALSSLTLADLMQVAEVRGLVEAARSAFQEYDKTDDGAYYSKMDDLLNAITPFTEPK